MSALTLKQQFFVKHYLIDLNATKAAIAAGYSAKTAEVAGSRLLRNVKVQQEIAKKTRKRVQKLEISADRVLNELALLGFANMQDYITTRGPDAYVDLSKLSRDQAAAIQEITSEVFISGTAKNEDGDEVPVEIKRTKLKLSDKRGALELLGKHLKLFTDKVESVGADGKPIETVKIILIGSKGEAAHA